MTSLGNFERREKVFFAAGACAVIGLLVLGSVIGDHLRGPSTQATSPDSAPAPDQPLDPEWARALEKKQAEMKRATIEAETVEAEDLGREYDENAVRADLKYRNRRIYIRGAVRGIETSGRYVNGYVVDLAGVYCREVA